MAVPRVRVGDVGTIMRTRVVDEAGAAVDISGGGVTREILITSPRGVVVTKVASLTASGTDGRMQFTSISTDFSAAGRWEMRSRVNFSAGAQVWTSDAVLFDVMEAS